MCAKRLILRRPNLSSFKGVYYRRLNDIHIAANATCAALVEYAASLAETPRKTAAKAKAYRHFEVPSSGRPTARIRREVRGLTTFIRQMAAEGEYQKSLVLAVSITEDYIVNILKLILRAHPDRITRGWRGSDGNRPQLLIDDFITRPREELVEELIWKKLNATLYTSPRDYLDYLRKILEIRISLENLQAFSEIKATRDIVVHANGIANATYVGKSDGLARVQAGEFLPVTDTYFNGSIAHMKRLIREVHDAVCLKYADDLNVGAQVVRFLD